MQVHRIRAVALTMMLASLFAACGDDATSDGGSVAGTTAGTTTTTRAGGASPVPTTTTPASSTSGTKLPDGCSLLDDTSASAAMGTAGTKSSPVPATEIQTRCEWKAGIYSISLLVRQGSAAKSDFDNAQQGKAATTLTGAQAAVLLGARETSRNYRLVSYVAYNGKYYVSITLQGPDRIDAAATETVATLVRSVLAKLPASP